MVFWDATIQFCLTIKVLFKLPLRQTTGMVASLLKMAGLNWAVPDDTSLCRHQKTLAVQMPYRLADGPLNLHVDSTRPRSSAMARGRRASMAFMAAANRCPAGDCPQSPRWRRRRHLAMDTATSDIRAVEFTPSHDSDSPLLPELRDQIPEAEEIGTVTADGADDTLQPSQHRPPGNRDHTDPQERRPWKQDHVETGLSGSMRARRNPACHPALWQDVLEALDPIPCPKPDRGERFYGL